jgi:hypothetical protein
LEHDAYALLEAPLVLGEIVAQHLDVSGCTLSMPFEYFNDRGLPSAIWTEESKDLALGNLQVHAVHGLLWAIGLMEALDVNGKVGHRCAT